MSTIITGTGDDGRNYKITIDASETPPSDDPPVDPPVEPPAELQPVVAVRNPAGATFTVAATNPTAATNPAGIGFDGFRGVGQLVLYTPPLQITGTNKWGTSAVLTPVSDHLARVLSVRPDVQGGVPVPLDGMVLSGHQRAGDYVAALHPGDLVTLVRAGDDTPTEPLPPSQSGRVRMLWLFPPQWGGPAVRDVPADVLNTCTHATFCVAQSAQGGTGRLTTPPDLTRDNVKFLHDYGVKVGATVGGSGDGGITVQDLAQATQFADSILTMPGPLDYVDVDLEASGRWTATGILAALKSVNARGEMLATITSGLYGPHTKSWGTVAQSLGSQLIGWVSMNYDFPEAGDSRLSAVVQDKLRAMRDYVGPAQRVMAFMPRPTPTYVNASPPAVLSAAWRAALAAEPACGFSVWESKILRDGGWNVWRDLVGA